MRQSTRTGVGYPTFRPACSLTATLAAAQTPYRRRDIADGCAGTDLGLHDREIEPGLADRTSRELGP